MKGSPSNVVIIGASITSLLARSPDERSVTPMSHSSKQRLIKWLENDLNNSTKSENAK